MGDNVFNKTLKADCDLTTESIENEINLEKCFKTIVEGNSIEFDVENLNTILKKDLRVNFYYLKPKLKFIIPYMLVHYIKCWPGWHKNNNYLTKQISFDSWFAKFKEYLVFKVNYLIKNDYEKVVGTMKAASIPIDESMFFKIDSATQISIPSEKSIAPYTIEVQGIPKILNSLIFCEGQTGVDSIELRKYKTKPFCGKLTTKQLINFPNVEVEFVSKELNFKRKNMHEFKRYLMLSNEKITFKKIDTFIEEAEIIDKQLSRSVYTLNVLKKYCNAYVEILRRHQLVMELSDEFIADVGTVFEEFITDIVDLDMNSMATNTSVLFNIGKYVYARNKSVRTISSQSAVSFAESITPKINVSLIYFTGIKEEPDKIPFQGLQNALESTDREFIGDFRPTLHYCCTFCNERYEKKDHILDHFQEKHCMEQPVLCFICKLQMDVTQICENRWNHKCRIKNSEGNVIR